MEESSICFPRLHPESQNSKLSKFSVNIQLSVSAESALKQDMQLTIDRNLELATWQMVSIFTVLSCSDRAIREICGIQHGVSPPERYGGTN